MSISNAAIGCLPLNHKVKIMVNKISFLILILFISFAQLKAESKSDSTQKKPFINSMYLTGGGGIGGDCALSSSFGKCGFLSLRYNKRWPLYQGQNFEDDAVYGESQQVSLQYGLQIQFGKGTFSLSCGPSYLTYDQPINIQAQSTGGWGFNFGNSGPSYSYSFLIHKNIGFTGGSQLNWNINEAFGIGCELFTDINQYYTRPGILFNLNLGLLYYYKHFHTFSTKTSNKYIPDLEDYF